MITEHTLAGPSRAGEQHPAPRHWTVDASTAVVRFTARELRLLTVTGRFGAWHARLERPAGASLPRVRAEVRADSIDTGIGRRDRDLRSPRFLDAPAFPVIAFRSLGWAAGTAAAPPVLRGELTIRERRLPVALEVDLSEDAGGDLRFTARGEIDRRAFGVGAGVPDLVIAPRIGLAVEGVARAAG